MAALITDMEQPLGRTAGNALEVREAVDVLRGGGPADVRSLTLALTARMCLLAGVATDAAAAERDLAARLDDGRALAAFRDMVAAQGGDIRVADDPGAVLPTAAVMESLPAPADGWVAGVDAEIIGRVVLQLGAGRRRSDDVIDPAAGVDCLVQCGDRVRRGDTLMRLQAATPDLIAAVRDAARGAVRLADAPVTRPPLILETLL
jgi:thymidine phosphorylase